MADRVLLDDVPLSSFHLRVTAYTTGGMFCDGYILGMIGIALAVWAPQVGLTSLWEGLIGASALVGIFLGALVFGPITDRVGRQTMYLADLVLFIIGSALQFFVDEPWQLAVLRLVMGIAIGADYAIGAALLSEFLPRRQRGPLLASLNAVWTVGFVVAFVVGYLMRDLGDESWRWMLASSAVPAIVVLCLRLGTPESPRWLAAQGRHEEADQVLREFFGPDVVLGPEPPSPRRARIAELFTPRWRRRTAFASLFWFCQVLPFFALFTFAPTVLKALGLADEFTGGLTLNLFQLAGGVVGVVVMNRLARRGFVIWSFVVLALSLLPLALASSPSATVVIASFAVFAFTVSAAGNLETVYPSELFPTELRATGVGFAASMSRIGAAVGTFLLPLSLDHFGNQTTMAIGVLVLLFGAVVSWAWAPETRHLALTSASAGDDLTPVEATAPATAAAVREP
ncbi:MAG: MFS transporter [Nocardioidaceae bacterium]|nr:MFS transporter [Nocardioidaceae bacterium]